MRPSFIIRFRTSDWIFRRSWFLLINTWTGTRTFLTISEFIYSSRSRLQVPQSAEPSSGPVQTVTLIIKLLLTRFFCCSLTLWRLIAWFWFHQRNMIGWFWSGWTLHVFRTCRSSSVKSWLMGTLFSSHRKWLRTVTTKVFLGSASRFWIFSAATWTSLT